MRENLRKNLPFIITMALFIIACAVLTAFTIKIEPQYVKFVPSEKTVEIDESISTVNLNTATAEQLQTLPRIGEGRANSIIAYRDKHGDFLYIEEIMEITGIGESIFGSIKEYITVD